MELKEFITGYKVPIAVIFLVAVALLFQSGGLHNLFQVYVGGPYQPGDTVEGTTRGTINAVNYNDGYSAICDGDTVYVYVEVKDPNGNIIDTTSLTKSECISYVPVGWSVKLSNDAIKGTYNVNAYYCAYVGCFSGTKHNFGSDTFEVIVPCAKLGESCGYSASAPECCSGLTCANFQCIESCNVGAQCKKDYDGKVCKSGDVYKKYKIYEYDSNCNCQYDHDSTEFYEDCKGQGCSNGVCESGPVCEPGWECQDSTHKAYKNSDCTWSSVTYCEYGCEDGVCKEEPGPGPCTNDCSAYGISECRNNINYFECGNYDADNCLEWSEGSVIIGKCGVECKENNDCPSGVCNSFKCEIGPTETCEDHNYLTNPSWCPIDKTPETINIGDLICYTGFCSSTDQTCELAGYYTNTPTCSEGETAETIKVDKLTCYTGECLKEDYIWMVLGGVVFLIIILVIVYVKVSGKRPYPPQGSWRHY